MTDPLLRSSLNNFLGSVDDTVTAHKYYRIQNYRTPTPILPCLSKKTLGTVVTKVFFDITIGGKPVGEPGISV